MRMLVKWTNNFKVMRHISGTWLAVLGILIFSLNQAFPRDITHPGDEEKTNLRLDSIYLEDSIQRVNESEKNLFQAKRYLKSNQLDSSLHFAGRIIEYDINYVPATIISEAYYLIGKINRIRGNINLALKNYLITINKLRYVEDYGIRSEVNQELALLYYENGWTNKAIEKYLDAYSIEVERNDTYKQLEILQQISALYMEAGEINNAVIYQEKLLPLYIKHNSAELKNLLQQLSDNYVFLKKYQQAINMQAQILEIERRSENLYGQLLSLLNVIEIYYESHDFDKFYNKGIYAFELLYNRTPDNRITSEILGLKGHELLYQGYFYEKWGDLNPPDDYYKALNYYDSALMVFEKIEDPLQAGKIHLNTAGIYFKLDEFRSCIEHSESAIERLESSRDFESLTKAFHLLAAANEKLDRYKNASKAFKQFIVFQDSVHNENKARIEELINKYTENANRMVFQNLEQSYIQQELDTMSEALLRLDIENYRKNIELLLTERELQNAVIKNQELEQRKQLQDIELYKQQLAAEEHENKIARLQTEMRERELELANRKLEQVRKEQQIKTLEQEQKLSAFELQKAGAQRIILILSVVIIFIVLVFMVLGYYNIRKSKVKITAKNKLIEENNQKLQELNEEKNRLIRIVAHDLKNPLTSALTMADLIKKRPPDDLHSDRQHTFGLIRRSLIRMQEMINKILDIKAIDEEKVNLELEAINVKQVMYYVVELFEEKLSQKDLQLMTDIKESYVLVDRNYFTQILENLVSNAIKFSARGKRIYIKTFNFEEKCRIMVKDEGPGLNEADMKKLFLEFKPLSAQPTDGESSTGLGLSIVKKFADLMKGRVWCESENGKGATFFVEFKKALVTA